MKKLLAALLTSVALLSLGCGNEQAEKAERTSDGKTIELHVATAASLPDAMKELAEAYKAEHPEITLTFNFGSSGALQQAIENGGETDLFFSAAQKQMDALEKSGNLAEGTRRDLLENSVVLVVPAGSTLDLKSFADLTRPELKHIALGEPKGVPVGQYAEEILTQLNILEQVKERAVYGSDVRQVLAWVAAGEADCGVVYATDAAIDSKVKVVSKAPEGSHKPVIYPAAVIKGTKHPEEAKAFLDFAGSGQGRKVFEKYGFICK
jgi:molybdate transport system substrate-binding protein